MDKHHTIDTMLCGENSDGEQIHISIHEDAIIALTFQKNHWIRRNIYHRDGTVEELFDGKWE